MLKVADDDYARHAKFGGCLVDPRRTDAGWDVGDAVREHQSRSLAIRVLLPFCFVALSVIEPFDDEVFGVDVPK
ncbi:hypothetical protein F5972_24880 [Microbispora cellulosiformans]|uniref:Uncharacterized protein n=1 Tax=Microbispora cellulosiformans TaxID=2614688 RepID=A0A5J5JZK3_9ACTN|nr:hypothetical protein [Microbispora cellulosiformans]KAA9375959.1 hypothetical protein F5972_24880 [Microbispora cellulosiformans]